MKKKRRRQRRANHFHVKWIKNVRSDWNHGIVYVTKSPSPHIHMAWMGIENFINQIFSCIRYVVGSFDRGARSIINIYVIYSLRARSSNYRECAWKCGERKENERGKNRKKSRANTKKHNSLLRCVCESCSNELNKDSAHLNVTLICYQLHSTVLYVRFFVCLPFLLTTLGAWRFLFFYLIRYALLNNIKRNFDRLAYLMNLNYISSLFLCPEIDWGSNLWSCPKHIFSSYIFNCQFWRTSKTQASYLLLELRQRETK